MIIVLAFVAVVVMVVTDVVPVVVAVVIVIVVTIVVATEPPHIQHNRPFESSHLVRIAKYSG